MYCSVNMEKSKYTSGTQLPTLYSLAYNWMNNVSRYDHTVFREFHVTQTCVDRSQHHLKTHHEILRQRFEPKLADPGNRQTDFTRSVTEDETEDDWCLPPVKTICSESQQRSVNELR